MPISPTYPGVYIQEAPSGVKAIVGVSTSTTAFVGYFKRGPLGSDNDAVLVQSYADFERTFGGLDQSSEAGYAVYQYFLNQGNEAYVIRTAAATAMPTTAKTTAQGLSFAAANPGQWGNGLQIRIDFNTPVAGAFNLSVTEYQLTNNQWVVNNTETFRNLSTKAGDANYAVEVIQEGSALLRIPMQGDLSLPPATGTTSGNLAALDLNLKGGDLNVTLSTGDSVKVTIPKQQFASLMALGSSIQAAVRAAAATKSPLKTLNFTLISQGDSRQLNFSLSDPGSASTTIQFDGAAKDLKLDEKNAAVNPQAYAPGGGTDGSPPGAGDLIGDQEQRTGMYALDNVEVFNLLAIPALINDPAGYETVVTEAANYCEQRRAFFLMDVPKTLTRVESMQNWMDQNGSLRNSYSAVYFPGTQIADPLNNYRPRTVAASGTLAGVYAATDTNRGYWKAPAGTEAVLENVSALGFAMTDGQNGTLNQIGVNCLRNFKLYGNICWGARTTDGADALGSQWKYVPVRRTALYIEQSLLRGLQWVVFEPNADPLWASIRLNVGAFLHGEFIKGAFAGTSPKEGYFVKCDSTTTTQNDINLGIVNIVVGFAPLKPAEFVIITIEQMAGQVQAG